MTTELEDVFARAADACSLLSPAAKPDVVELIAAARQAMGGTELDDAAVLSLKKRLGALVEVVARRDARAMPFAALGRAALATLHSAHKDAAALLTEFSTKLSMLGM